MAEQARLDEAVVQLNALLGDVTPYKLAVVAPGDVQHVAKNARYMPSAMYRQLVDNIKRDGNLASLPFCWRKADGVFVVLSGNHRVDAARDAGISSILVLYTDAQLSKSQAVSIQLSHNALAGADVPTVLLELWQEIDSLQDKSYAGLDEALLDNLAKASVVRIDRAGLEFEEMSLLFLSSEIERIKETLKRLGGGATGVTPGCPCRRLRRLFRHAAELQRGDGYRQQRYGFFGHDWHRAGVAGGAGGGERGS